MVRPSRRRAFDKLGHVVDESGESCAGPADESVEAAGDSGRDEVGYHRQSGVIVSGTSTEHR